jgi:fibronectin type 3 domain-containing protein
MSRYLNDILQYFRGNHAPSPWNSLRLLLALALLTSCGGSGSSGGGGGNGTAPSVPTGVTATAGSQQVSLSWNASAGATSYNVKRSTTSGSGYSTVSSPSTTGYTDTGLTNGTTYYYVVTAVNAQGESGNSAQASATPAAAPPPGAPTGLTATAGNQQVALSWGAVTGATGYNVKRSTTSGSGYSTVSSPSTASYTDTGLTDGTTYYYVVTATSAAGESANSTQVSATPVAAPAAPTGLTATAGNQQVALSWAASSGAASYNVKRSTTNGSGYSTVNSPTTTTYTDTGLTNGTTYYYVVTAVNAGGQSGNSNQASATPTSSTSASVHVTVDVLTNRHLISPYVYGGSYPQDAATITDSGLSVVRWGGNGTSTYNWKLFTNNADNDYFFEDFAAGALNNSADADSTQFIKDVKTAGSHPLTTMAMLPWVAQSPETSTTQGGTDNYHWVFSVSQDGACSSNVDPYNTDAGINLKSDCSTAMVATNTQISRAYFPLLDGPPQSGDPANSVYRNQWAAALATAFGSGTCAIPNSSITSCHFYDMDNEIDIWGGTHVDIHPTQSGYNELRDTYLTEARNLKTWDSAAVRFGPVSCCWYFYWNLNSTIDDKATHAGIDFLPWWLNEVAWSDAIAGTRSLDVFDIHAYPDADTGSLNHTQLQALAARVYRDWWDPTYTSEAAYIDNNGFSIEPLEPKPFRIPRMRAILNETYPGTQFSITEWSAAFAGETDFSTALGDADAYGILGRERVALASRWEAPSPDPDPVNHPGVPSPNYLALKLYTNYDGAHHGFGTTSVSDTNDGNASLFSSYAALNSAGTQMTLLVLNKDPQNAVTAALALNGFTPTSYVAYTLAASAPTTITASTSSAWSSTQTFAPYTATLLLITGSMAATPQSEWDLNPDTVMVAAGGTVTLSPKIIKGTANVTLGSGQSDAGITVAITQSSVSTSQNGTVTVTAGNMPGFYHYTVTGTDSGATQTQGGYIVVGNPPAGLAIQGGNNQSGSAGSALAQALTVTLTPGQSGGTAGGASIFFTTNAGTLSNGTTSGSKVIAITNSSGVASVTLTLPATAQTVQVQAQAPYGLGGATLATPFTETAN